jgi:hypothetical protein
VQDSSRHRALSGYRAVVAECPLLAQSRHELLHCTRPLSGVKRTLRHIGHLAAYLDLGSSLLTGRRVSSISNDAETFSLSITELTD